MKSRDHAVFFLLDSINPHAIKAWIKRHEKIIDYAAQHYSFFSARRAKIMDELKRSLLDEQMEFPINKSWKRIVSHQFSNTPLATTGSVLNFPGQPARREIAILSVLS